MVANTKTKARLVILAAFTLGVLAGVAGMNMVSTKYAQESSRMGMLDEMTQELKLNEDQRSQIQTMFRQTRKESQEIMKPVQPQLLELRNRTRAQIRTVLTPEQQVRFDNWNRKKDEEKDRKDQASASPSPSPASK